MVLIYISLMADDTEHSCWLFVGLYVVFGEHSYSSLSPV